MSKRSWLIRQTPTQLELYTLFANRHELIEVIDTTESCLTEPEILDAVSDSLKSKGCVREEIMLSIESRQCLAAAFAIEEGSVSRRDNESLYYELEEHLPLAAEDVVADFSFSKANIFAVALAKDMWRDFLSQLQERKIVITSICPYVLLALQELMQSEAGKNATVLVCTFDDHVEVVVLENGSPVEWQYLPGDRPTLARFLTVFCMKYEDRPNVHFIRPGNEQSDIADLTLAGVSNITTEERSSDSMLEVACRSAYVINRGKRRPWIQLAKSHLAIADPYRSFRAPLLAAIGAFVLLGAVTTGALMMRSRAYEQESQRFRAEQVALFRDIFPEHPIPIGIRPRLESEYMSIRGLTDSDEELPQPGSSLETLGHVLQALPTDMRFRLLEIRIEGELLDIDGEARSHGDADLIASAVRAAGYDVSVPNTQQLADQGVGFRLVGRHVNAAMDEEP